jgi:hypothetical protein
MVVSAPIVNDAEQGHDLAHPEAHGWDGGPCPAAIGPALQGIESEVVFEFVRLIGHRLHTGVTNSCGAAQNTQTKTGRTVT